MAKINKTIFIIILIVLTLIPMVIALQKTFTVEETDLVNVMPNAIDPDEEVVSYSFQKPLNDSGQWQTSYDDEGEYGIEITASDGVTSASERITLIVEGKNRAPEVQPLSITVNEGETITLNLPEKDLDGDVLIYEFDKPLNDDGTWETSFSDEGEYQFTIKVSDGDLTSTTTVDITINNFDRPLFLSVPKVLEAKEGEEFNWEIDVHDPDGDEINLKVKNLPEGAIIEDNTITWIPNYNEIKKSEGLISNSLNALRLEKYFLKQKTIPIEVEACSNDLCEKVASSLIIHNVNQKPIFEPIENITITATEKLKIDFTATDLDGDVIKYYFSQPIGKHNGVWKTKRDDVGEYTVYVTANDGKEQTSVPIKINVLKDNRAPKLKVNQQSFLVNENEEIEISLKAKDRDNDNVTFSIKNLPQGASLDGNIFRWTPPYYEVSERSNSWEDNLISKVATLNRGFNSEKNVRELEFVASDGQDEDVSVVKVTIKNVNLKPRLIDFLPTIDATVKTHDPIIFHVVVKDNDEDKLDYSWSFSLHEPRVKGTDTIERTFVTPGRKKVKVTVSDGRESVEVVWRIKVVENEEIIREKLLEQELSPVMPIKEKFNVYVIDG